MSLVTELERLADALGEKAEAASRSHGPSVAERIAKNLGVKADEVGILGLSERWRHLYFLVPEALQKCWIHSTDQQLRVGGTYRPRESP